VGTTPGIIGGHNIWRVAPGATFELVEPQEWMSDAACRGVEPEVFFPSTDGWNRARAICAECPVAGQCREWNDRAEGGVTTVGILYGLYAGETPKERAARRKRGGHDPADVQGVPGLRQDRPPRSGVSAASEESSEPDEG
jgi:WhiB family redox-sensing transcriptional regulator